MKPTENIERWIKLKKLRITTSDQPDKRVLDDCFAAMEETVQAKSADNKPNVWKIILRGRITKFAAAVVIVIAVGFLATPKRPRRQAGTPTISRVAKSPAEMLTAMSLNIAYRRGGMKEMEKQCEKAFEMLESPSTQISIQELLAEFNGT